MNWQDKASQYSTPARLVALAHKELKDRWDQLAVKDKLDSRIFNRPVVMGFWGSYFVRLFPQVALAGGMAE